MRPRYVEVLKARPGTPVVPGSRLYRKSIPSASVDGAIAVVGRDLLALMVTAIEAARTRVLVTQFVIDVRPTHDTEGDGRGRCLRYEDVPLTDAHTDCINRAITEYRDELERNDFWSRAPEARRQLLLFSAYFSLVRGGHCAYPIGRTELLLSQENLVALFEIAGDGLLPYGRTVSVCVEYGTG